jgi:dihydroxyacetone kinase
MTSNFLLDSASPVRQALIGFALSAAGDVRVNLDPMYVTAARHAPGRTVALVSGGGAGHEPMHAAFVGVGGLDAACPGEIFTSPHNGQIYAASSAVALPGGVLHIVKNYTGDVINFRVAAERLAADGIEVATVLVDDDLGSEAAASTIGRRGTGATVVLEKILGAAADAGLDLAHLKRLGDGIVTHSRSLAVANVSHTSPDTGLAAFDVTPGDLEYGVGIHGETAAQTIVQPSLEVLVARMISELHAAVPDAAADAANRYVLFVNGLGAITALELQHILAEASRALVGNHEAEVVSAICGTYISALDMRGFSITLTAIDDEWLPFLFAEHETALPRPVPAAALLLDDALLLEDATVVGDALFEDGGLFDAGQVDPGLLADVAPSIMVPDGYLSRLHGIMTARRLSLNALDQKAGDGDMGSNLAQGLELAMSAYVPGAVTLDADLARISQVFLNDVGGSSGPLFGLVFQDLSRAVSAAAALGGTDGASVSRAVTTGLRSGLAAVQRVGGAVADDRTMVDALAPAVAKGIESLDEAAVRAGIAGARHTSDLIARRGRASYVGARAVGSPDPGAVAVAVILVALLEHLGNAEEPLAEDLWPLIDALIAD